VNGEREGGERVGVLVKPAVAATAGGVELIRQPGSGSARGRRGQNGPTRSAPTPSARQPRWSSVKCFPRTLRVRLTLLYGGLFVVSGAALLAITYLLVLHFTANIQITTDAAGQQSVQGVLPGGQSIPPKRSLAVASHVQASYLHQLFIESGVALAIMTVVSIWLGWLVAGRVLRPLRLITATTLRISQENLHERLDLPGPRDDLTDLADTIDGLLERMETAFDAQRRFVANASHELRTPLAMMRTSLDVAEGKPQPVPRQVVELAGKLRAGLDQADRLIESFLDLARAYRSSPEEAVAVSLADLVTTALAVRELHAADLGIQLNHELSEVTVAGDPTLLRRLVDNLLDNALRYNYSGGFVRVSCQEIDSGTGREAFARLVVENTGPVLQDTDVRQLGRPFHRVAPDRTTTGSVGLGLSIVTAIAAAYDGKLALSARPTGGLRAVVDVPRASWTKVPGACR